MCNDYIHLNRHSLYQSSFHNLMSGYAFVEFKTAPPNNGTLLYENRGSPLRRSIILIRTIYRFNTFTKGLFVTTSLPTRTGFG